jgi:hypothetical protein
MQSTCPSAVPVTAPSSSTAYAGGIELRSAARTTSIADHARAGLPSNLRLLLVVCLILLASTAAWAQAPNGLRNSYRIVVTTGSPGTEFSTDSGWQTAGPLVTPGTISSSTPSGCASQGSCTSTSDYGFLRCAGTGNANNCTTNGAFLNLDDGAGAPWAEFRDTLTVLSNTLPPGSPVDVSYALTLSGHCTAQGPPYSINYTAWMSNGRGAYLAQNNSLGALSSTFTAYVGTPYSIRAVLTGSVYIYSILNVAPPALSASYSVDLRAKVSFDSLAPGAYLQFASGHDYSSWPLAYCTAGTSTHGCSASISGNANPSMSLANACNLTVSNVEGQKSGLMFYGVNNTGFTPLPWTPGSTSLLCVKPPTQRTFILNSGGTSNACNGSFVLDWNAFQSANPLALGSPWSTGAKVYAQAWFRDPPAPKSTNLSNALEMTYVP